MDCRAESARLSSCTIVRPLSLCNSYIHRACRCRPFLETLEFPVVERGWLDSNRRDRSSFIRRFDIDIMWSRNLFVRTSDFASALVQIHCQFGYPTDGHSARRKGATVKRTTDQRRRIGDAGCAAGGRFTSRVRKREALSCSREPGRMGSISRKQDDTGI